MKGRTFVGGTGQPGAKICYGQTIQLVANGGTSYEWIPSTYLDNPLSKKPFCTPFSSIKYTIVVKGASCSVPDTTQLSVNVADSLSARFTVNISQGCAPVKVKVTNSSYGATEKYTRWEWGDGTYTYGTFTPPVHTYRNTTDSAIDYNIHLVVRNDYCVDSWDRIVRVYPEINAGFTQDTTVGCHPLTVNFTDTSSGNLDPNRYIWDFGDLSQSYDVNPTHTFTNIGTIDSLFNVRLITESPFLCKDTAEKTIMVHPFIKASLAIDTAIGCSPLKLNLDASKSIGVDTFLWNIKYPTYEDLINTTSYNPVNIDYTDTSQSNGPDTLKVNLIVQNRMGCTDTIPQQKIIVFPEVKALFDVDALTICDSLPIHFTNNSTGYKLLNHWDFGDGRTAQDITDMDYTRIFRNQTISTKSYVITLQTTSDYSCTSTYDTTIQVHPYIKADFTLDYTNNCTPLDVSIQNQSIRVSNYTWDFGDGTPVDHSSAPTLTHQFWNPLEDSDTTYMIQLAVQNPEGCVDTLERNITLLPQVVAAFVMTDSVGCNPLSIVFSNQSKGKNLYYSWDFAGITSPTNSPVFSRTFNHYGATIPLSILL